MGPSARPERDQSAVRLPSDGMGSGLSKRWDAGTLTLFGPVSTTGEIHNTRRLDAQNEYPLDLTARLRVSCRHPRRFALGLGQPAADRKSTRLNSSHGYISHAVFCLI